MNYKIEDLKDTARFKLIKTLHYTGIIEFVFKNIQNKNLPSRFYTFFNLFILVIIIGLSVSGFQNDLFNFKDYIFSFLWGFLSGSIFVIPLHELIHGLAYKLKGAPKINFGADLGQAIFYVAADNFVIGKKTFFFVAIAPFVTINILALFLINFSGPSSIISILFFLLFHNIMCIGDFAMISFFVENKAKELFTYDDHKERTSYIYEAL